MNKRYNFAHIICIKNKLTNTSSHEYFVSFMDAQYLLTIRTSTLNPKNNQEVQIILNTKFNQFTNYQNEILIIFSKTY